MGGDDSDKIRKKLTEIDCLRETSKALKEMADAAGADREICSAWPYPSTRFLPRPLPLPLSRVPVRSSTTSQEATSATSSGSCCST